MTNKANIIMVYGNIKYAESLYKHIVQGIDI